MSIWCSISVICDAILLEFKKLIQEKHVSTLDGPWTKCSFIVFEDVLGCFHDDDLGTW